MMIVQEVKLFGFAPDELDESGFKYTHDAALNCIAHSKLRPYYGFATSSRHSDARPDYKSNESAAFEAYNFHIKGTDLLCDVKLYDKNGGQMIQWATAERNIPMQVHLQGSVSSSGGVVHTFMFSHLWIDLDAYSKALKTSSNAEANAYLQAEKLAHEMASKYRPAGYNNRTFEPPEWAIRAIMQASQPDPRLRLAIDKLDRALNPLQ